MATRWVCGSVGLLLLLAAALTALSIQRFVHHATRADAVVTSLTAGGSHPRLRFVTLAGQDVTFSAGGLIFGYRIGQHATVFYRPDRPLESASLATPGSLWFLPLMLTLIGLGWILVPVGQALL